jgi:hypothetical protein
MSEPGITDTTNDKNLLWITSNSRRLFFAIATLGFAMAWIYMFAGMQ